MKSDFERTEYTEESVTVNGEKIAFRAYEHIVYVQKPIDPQRQELSVYVPSVYYNDDYKGEYDLRTAPIFFPNTVGGYRPGYYQKPGINHHGKLTASAYALQKGYIVVCPTTRGIGLKNEQNENYGMAPATLVDLKAAIRYLRHFDQVIPGDKEKIITNGTSAGGAMSSLLGSTGNHPDYEPYLEEIGAYAERDDVFASSCYCPITNLDHADMAYEWEFFGQNESNAMTPVIDPELAKEAGVTEEMIASLTHDGHPDFQKIPADLRNKIVKMKPVKRMMSDEQIRLSAQLKESFPDYVNQLGLKSDGKEISLNKDGSGSFRDYVAEAVKQGMLKAVDNGIEFDDYDWITTENGKPVSFDWDTYISFRTRMKSTPAFDQVHMPFTPENMAFGNKTTDNRHFTEFSLANGDAIGMAEKQQIKLYNPMYYIDDEKAIKARHYRIMTGAIDRDTSLAIGAMLNLKLQMAGIDTDYHIPWGIPHSGDYDIDDMFAWIDTILQK